MVTDMTDFCVDGTTPLSEPGMPRDEPFAAVQRPTFREALRFWFKLGWISFGGTAAHIAIMHDDLVETKRWISNASFLHALSHCMLLPGPEAQQLAIYIGWKLHGKLKAGFNMPDHVALVRSNLAKPDSRWKVVGGAPIVMISQARIVAAVERGDGTGFCQGCGATAHNVEPDARGYTCESCGKPDVYGAEELLMGGAL